MTEVCDPLVFNVTLAAAYHCQILKVAVEFDKSHGNGCPVQAS
jgi:hypothetical protein